MTQETENKSGKLSKESILQLVNRIAIPHIIVALIMCLIVLFYLFSFAYFQTFIAHQPIRLLLSYPITIAALILFGIFKYLLYWRDWRDKVRQALLLDNGSVLIVRFEEKRGKIEVEFFDEKFPQRKSFNGSVFKDTSVNDSLGHKFSARVYMGVVWSTPVAIETEKSFLLVGEGTWIPTNKDLIEILRRTVRFKWPWQT
jgi:hypothetical protein